MLIYCWWLMVDNIIWNILGNIFWIGIFYFLNLDFWKIWKSGFLNSWGHDDSKSAIPRSGNQNFPSFKQFFIFEGEWGDWGGIGGTGRVGRTGRIGGTWGTGGIIDYWLLIINYWLLIIDYWLLIIEYYLLVINMDYILCRQGNKNLFRVSSTVFLIAIENCG